MTEKDEFRERIKEHAEERAMIEAFERPLNDPSINAKVEWILNRYKKRAGSEGQDVKQVSEQDMKQAMKQAMMNCDE